ncbi:MAG: putative toxin-antitoxin system toxin component, PIN family [Rubrivivax sp.]
MSRQAVIVDTNVVVAGLLMAHEASPVARILDGMLAAALPFVVSEALLAEYRTVLVRPHLRKLHGLTVAEVDAILTDLAQHAIVLTPVKAPPAPDPGDPLLWELLAARADLLLITGDKQLLRDAGMPGPVVSPQAFVAGVDVTG